jgi:hypothetical protein
MWRAIFGFLLSLTLSYGKVSQGINSSYQRLKLVGLQLQVSQRCSFKLFILPNAPTEELL